MACPPVPPRKHRRRHTPPRPPSNGLPPTPKVHMGACFSKVGTFYLQTSKILCSKKATREEREYGSSIDHIFNQMNHNKGWIKPFFD